MDGGNAIFADVDAFLTNLFGYTLSELQTEDVDIDVDVAWENFDNSESMELLGIEPQDMKIKTGHHGLNDDTEKYYLMLFPEPQCSSTCETEENNRACDDCDGRLWLNFTYSTSTSLIEGSFGGENPEESPPVTFDSTLLTLQPSLAMNDAGTFNVVTDFIGTLNIDYDDFVAADALVINVAYNMASDDVTEDQLNAGENDGTIINFNTNLNFDYEGEAKNLNHVLDLRIRNKGSKYEDCSDDMGRCNEFSSGEGEDWVEVRCLDFNEWEQDCEDTDTECTHQRYCVISASVTECEDGSSFHEKFYSTGGFEEGGSFCHPPAFEWEGSKSSTLFINHYDDVTVVDHDATMSYEDDGEASTAVTFDHTILINEMSRPFFSQTLSLTQKYEPTSSDPTTGFNHDYLIIIGDNCDDDDCADNDGENESIQINHVFSYAQTDTPPTHFSYAIGHVLDLGEGGVEPFHALDLTYAYNNDEATAVHSRR